VIKLGSIPVPKKETFRSSPPRCSLKGKAAAKHTAKVNAQYVKGKECASHKVYDREGFKEGRAVYVYCPKGVQQVKKAQPIEFRIGANKEPRK
jgi:hypothetical protein